MAQSLEHDDIHAGAISSPSDVREIESLAEAREAIEDCQRCPLYKAATQAVFGEGPAHADLMFVGEQPGDQEDLSGEPFVGPAGRMFDKCLERVGIDRKGVFVTNAVKHFKFVPRGKKRLHKRPDADEIAACRFWLELEMSFVRPKAVVALGATAARSLLGKTVTISRVRGAPITREEGPAVFVTVHRPTCCAFATARTHRQSAADSKRTSSACATTCARIEASPLDTACRQT